MTAAPVISGTQLRLRPHVMSDMDAFGAFYQCDRAQYVTKPDGRTHLWYGFASEVGSWALTGMGSWAIDVDGQLAGQISISHPPHFPETEIGWIVFDGFEGRGIAFEAATLALAYTRSTIRPASLVSYIDADNARSIALAKRLGATLDPQAEKWDDVDVVYRHRVEDIA
ncbi:MAG: GNAT family N-acetyltransferase [Pseudomonadota bacterium]